MRPDKTPSLHLLCALAAAVLLASCSTTKLIPDDDQLFVGLTRIDYRHYEPGDHFEETKAEIEAALATAPNGALFGSSYYRTPFPYGLWIWNYAEGSSGKFKQWLNKSFGKPPVLMSKVNPTLRASVAQSVLRSHGYMHGDVAFTEVPQKNPKKMKIGYTVTLDTLFTVDTLSYVGYPAPMQALIDSTRTDRLIAPGSPFSVSLLDGERTRLSRLFRNNGYYFYQPSYASFLADTTATRCHAQLRLQLADSLPGEALRPWHIGKTSLALRRSAREQLTDTIQRRRLDVIFSGKRPPVRPRVLLRDIKLRHRMPYSYDDYTESVQKINSTGVFSTTDFQFTPRPGTDTLDLSISCTMGKPYDFYIEGDLKNRTIGRFGPEVRVGYTMRNVFRGAEKLDIALHGSYEWQYSGERSKDMNSFQYGLDAAIEFPRIIAPFVHERVRRRSDGTLRRPRRFYSTPWTVAKISTSVVRRPRYYKMHIVSGEWTYRWQPSLTSRHEFSPLTLKYQFMNSHTDEFDSLRFSNPYIDVSMSDYFIPKMRYTYTYASPTTYQSPIRWETTLEESGNGMALWDVVVQGHRWADKEKTFFRNPYSQFLKIETDLTKTWRLGTQSQLVGHLGAGYLHYYGNSSHAPFSELFYVGGAYSLRAFTVRSIGPGRFPSLQGLGRQFSYMMQNGNLKLVANLEYRTRLFGHLYGAVFLDAGNVWSDEDYTIEASDDMPTDLVDEWNATYGDTRLHPSRLLDQLATGTGLGLRYDLDFFVLRIDWGFGLHVPYKTSKSGYFNIERFRDMHALHLAIGYPF